VLMCLRSRPSSTWPIVFGSPVPGCGHPQRLTH